MKESLLYLVKSFFFPKSYLDGAICSPLRHRERNLSHYETVCVCPGGGFESRQTKSICVVEKYRERKQEVGRRRKLYLDVRLCSKVVDFSGFNFIDNLYQARAVSQVSVVQLHVYKAQNKRHKHSS